MLVELGAHPGFDTLIVLGMGHFVCDFPLQTDRMAIEKVPGKDVTLNWRWWLMAHGATHGLAVALITTLPVFGLMEMVMHCYIDWLKGRFKFSLGLDQSLHMLCKLAWVILIFHGL